MATYTFRREDGYELDARYPISEVPDEIVCDDGVSAVRVIRPGAGHVFKGEGWGRDAR
jgi:hypothetical protein